MRMAVTIEATVEELATHLGFEGSKSREWLEEVVISRLKHGLPFADFEEIEVEVEWVN